MEIDILSGLANAQFINNNLSEAHQLARKICNIIQEDPAQLSNVRNFASLGKSYVFMLASKLYRDADTMHSIAGLAYLFVSKAIENDRENLDFYKDRLLMLEIGREPFKYVVGEALELGSSVPSYSIVADVAPRSIRDAVTSMEFVDFDLNPLLCNYFPFLSERKTKLDLAIPNQFVWPDIIANLNKTGSENHKIVYDYLTKKVFEEVSIDF